MVEIGWLLSTCQCPLRFRSAPKKNFFSNLVSFSDIERYSSLHERPTTEIFLFFCLWRLSVPLLKKRRKVSTEPFSASNSFYSSTPFFCFLSFKLQVQVFLVHAEKKQFTPLEVDLLLVFLHFPQLYHEGRTFVT